MLNNTSEVIDKINESYLPANFEADKMLQKIIQLVKSKKEQQYRAYRPPGVKNSVHLVLIAVNTYIWTNDWLFQQICAPL